MKAYKCSLCGGTLIPFPDGQTGRCEYCKTVSPLLTDHSETVMNYMNRATDYRLACDYDRAIQIYDEVLKLSSTDPEAHWGMLLCKYGVEYVKDATTAEYSIGKLTLHRLSTVTVFDDPDYQAAIRYASPTNRATYEERAKEINKALQAALEEVRTATPFDIFLSYKEKDDETGIRTDDSFFVHDLYNELTGRGYKVFFAPKSLGAGVFESKIYAALVSSKTMLVVGSKESYFNAVWVKNEWKRFLEMKKRGENKQIIPIFRNASPQIIPVELAGENALDANTIDFLPRLVEILDENKANKLSSQGADQASSQDRQGLEKLIQNAETFLKLNKIDTAKELYQTISHDYPEDHRGWWGLIVCETKTFSDMTINLKNANIWFKYVEQLTDKKQFLNYKQTYTSYLTAFSHNEMEQEVQKQSDRIEELTHQVESLERQKEIQKKKIESIHNQIESGIKNEEMKQKMIRNNKNLMKLFIILIIVTVITAISLFIIFNNADREGACWLAILGGAGFSFLFFCGASFAYTTNQGIKKWVKEVQKETNNHKNSLSSEEKEQDRLSSEIARYTTQRLQIDDYLKIGKTRIEDLFFYYHCSDIGVSTEYDKEADDYRKKAYGIIE